MNKNTEEFLRITEGFALWRMVLKFMNDNKISGYIVNPETTELSIEAADQGNMLVIPPAQERIVKELITELTWDKEA